MERNRLDPDEQQSELARALIGAEPAEPYRNPLASSNFKQFEWAKDHPQVAGSLAQLLQYLSWPLMRPGPMAMQRPQALMNEASGKGAPAIMEGVPRSDSYRSGRLFPLEDDVVPGAMRPSNDRGTKPGYGPEEIYQEAQHAQKLGFPSIDQWRASVDARKTNRFLDALQGKPPVRERQPFDVIPGGLPPKKD